MLNVQIGHAHIDNVHTIKAVSIRLPRHQGGQNDNTFVSLFQEIKGIAYWSRQLWRKGYCVDTAGVGSYKLWLTHEHKLRRIKNWETPVGAMNR